MKRKLIALALLASIGTSVFATEVKKEEDFSRKYKAMVLQSVVFGKAKVLAEGNEVSGAVATSAVVGAGAVAGLATANGAAMNGVVNGAASGLIVGAIAGLIIGAIASSANASTIECMDNATNNGEKMECASTTWAHIHQLYAQAGLTTRDVPVPMPLNLDNTRQTLGAFWEDNPTPQKLSDGTPIIKFATVNMESVPTVITIAGEFKGEGYAVQYPESLGYEWKIQSVQKYDKSVVVRNLLDREQWDSKVVPFLNDPTNFAKS